MESSRHNMRQNLAVLAIMGCLCFCPSCSSDHGTSSEKPQVPSGPTFSDIQDATTSLTLGDIDGDGFLDLIVGNELEPILLYLNRGTHVPFEQSPAIELTTEAMAAVVATEDFDNDGFTDLVIGQHGGPNLDRPILMRLNELGYPPYFGEPFRLQTPSEGAGSVSMATGDVDGDGDTDLVSAHGYNEGGVWFAHYGVLLHENIGENPFFVNLPLRYLARAGTYTSDTRDVEIGDLNGDDLLDIVVGRGNGDSVTPRGNLFFENLGNGGFAESRHLFEDFPRVDDLELGDLDNDGDLDVALIKMAREMDPVEEILIYFNDGSGNFSPRYSIGENQYGLFSCLELGDVNGDGMLDLFVGGWGAERIMFNDGGDLPFEKSQWIEFGDSDSPTQTAVFGDLDNDGALDLVLGNWRAVNQVFLNDFLVSCQVKSVGILR